ncbi:TPA: hypothetical protein ACG3IY_003568 [Clostridioides difficile]|nr:hypothetical protein [Clostridioides difficile]
MNEILEIVDSYKHFLKPHKIECIKYLLKVRIEYLKKEESCMNDLFDDKLSYKLFIKNIKE